MKFYHRIRTKLAVAFLLVAGIPAAAIGIYSMRVSSETLMSGEFDSQAALVGKMKQEIESFLADVRGDVVFLSESTPVQEYLKLRRSGTNKETLEAARRGVEREFLSFSKNRQVYHQVRYLDETGLETVRVDSDGTTSKLIPIGRLQNKAGRYYFADSVNLPAGSVFVSPLDLNRERGKVEVPHKPVIRYAVPVKYVNGDKAGVVLVNVDAKGFLGNLGETMLVDAGGYYLSHPDDAKAWGSERDLDTGHNINDDFPAIAGRMLLGSADIMTVGDAVMSYQQAQIPGTSQHWTLISRRPISDLLASVSEFRTTFIIIIAGAMAVALMLALVVGARITRPIEYLTEMAQKVSTGELRERVSVRDKGEIGQLAQAFERMRISTTKLLGRLQPRARAAAR